jgi:hypothetical protein
MPHCCLARPHGSHRMQVQSLVAGQGGERMHDNEYTAFNTATPGQSRKARKVFANLRFYLHSL